MTDLTLSTAKVEDDNPFEKIKQTNADGSVFWSARDLQPLMGYATWAKFMTPVRRAMQAAKNTGLDADVHFSRSGKTPMGGGPAQIDYKLTREAAYFVAMNGDPNKLEVAAAQAYFVGMTLVGEQVVREAREALEEPDMTLLMLDTARKNYLQGLENKKEIAEVKTEVVEHGTRLDGHDADIAEVKAAVELDKDSENWTTALGFVNRYNYQVKIGEIRTIPIPTDRDVLIDLGKRAVKVGTARGLAITKEKDGRYGLVNSWPEEVWSQALADLIAGTP
jgi:DNA-damage-inducible protein D